MAHELVELARNTIESSFQEKEFEPSDEIKEKYSEYKASFVTLTEKDTGNLRGCIGTLPFNAGYELWKDVQKNSLNAAFNDPRFNPLTQEELDSVLIEVSVLSKPEKIEFSDEQELLNKIDSEKGLILKKDSGEATFLPQVWEQISDKREFLENLSLKAGLGKDDWRDADIWFYNVEKYKEE